MLPRKKGLGSKNFFHFSASVRIGALQSEKRSYGPDKNSSSGTELFKGPSISVKEILSIFSLYFHLLDSPGGGHMTWGWNGVCRPVFRKLPPSNYRQLPSYTFYDEFWRKTPYFSRFFANFWKTHPCFKEIYRKRDHCLENS